VPAERAIVLDFREGVLSPEERIRAKAGAGRRRAILASSSQDGESCPGESYPVCR
jgi:hypothetical protein